MEDFAEIAESEYLLIDDDTKLHFQKEPAGTNCIILAQGIRDYRLNLSSKGAVNCE